MLCLQEIKVVDDNFPFLELKAAGYRAAVYGQKAYNGVAIVSRAVAASGRLAAATRAATTVARTAE